MSNNIDRKYEGKIYGLNNEEDNEIREFQKTPQYFFQIGKKHENLIETLDSVTFCDVI